MSSGKFIFRHSMTKNFAKVFSAELEGADAKLIEVEADINVGLHAFNIVGLADKALNEAKERVNSALKNSNVKPPNKENRKITINLAPADIKKTGSQYDLAIAMGYLLATQQIKEFNFADKIFIGELALDGQLRRVSGALNIAQLAKKLDFQYLFLPQKNAAEAAIIDGIKIVGVDNLISLIDFLEGRREMPAQILRSKIWAGEYQKFEIDIDDIKGQENAKRALAVAAAGGHNILMHGPPGTGKTMLAQTFVSLLPPPTLNEAIEITKIYSAAGMLDRPLINFRPFRAPHHSASTISIIGGGVNPRPGEISLSHRGVLFLDEIAEFPRQLLEALRQPLEAGTICVSRAKNILRFPAKFLLIAAMNPCPCGYFGETEKDCVCSVHRVFQYQKKLSGPLLDRIDIQIKVSRIKIEELRESLKVNLKDQSASEKIKNSINKARAIQQERFSNFKKPIALNSEMTSKMVDEIIHLAPAAENFLKNILKKSFVSGRGYYRLLKISRTIADLEESEEINVNHLAEAFQYRTREFSD